MSGTAGKEPPVVPPKERSPSPDDGLLREEPLELESSTKPPTTTTSTTATAPATIPTAAAPLMSGQTATAPPAPITAGDDDSDIPPPKPPRPVSQFEQNVATLAEAFPDVDLAVIKAVLTASGGRVEPSFHALLSMSDPSAAAELEEAPPPQPPRPRPQQQTQRDLRSEDHYSPARVYHDVPTAKTSTSASQLEADEIYARQLAEHYGAIPAERTRQGRGGYGNYPENRRRPESEEDKEPSFFDDELPVIRENLRKGFIDTQTKFNRFLTDLGKKFGGEEDDDDQHQQHQQRPQGGAGAYRQQGGGGGGGPYGGPQQYPQRYSSRRAGDAYDADPEVIQGDFSHLELRDNTTDEPRRNRPVANPNLFSSGNPALPASPGGNGGGGRKVGFANQSEEDLYRKPTTTNTRSGPAPSALRGSSPVSNAPGGKPASKWEPLSSVEPTPINNDPFQLADSDDEQDNVTTTAAKTGPQETGTKTAASK